MSIRSKLIMIVVGLVLCGGAGAGWISYAAIQANAKVAAAGTNALLQVKTLRSVRAAVTQADGVADQAIAMVTLPNIPEIEAAIFEARTAVEADLVAMRERADTPSVTDSIDVLQDELARWFEDVNVVLGVKASTAVPTMERLAKAERAVQASLAGLEDVVNTTAASQSGQAESQFQNDLMTAASASALMIGIALLLGILTALNISKGLRKLTSNMKQAAELQYTPDLSMERRNDELGQASRTVADFSMHVQDVAAVAHFISQGDLLATIEPQSDQDHLAHGLREMVAKLRGVVEDIRRNATSVHKGSDEVQGLMAQIEQGGKDQAAAVQQASAAIEQMLANIRQSSEGAKETEQIATEAAKKAGSSGKVVGEAVSAMQVIAEKIGIIQEIARQTDLLALNAAVEAARAGEHGRGFSVVASEVRKLAERSQEAASEISELSSSTVRKANDAGQMIEQMLPEIQMTAELVQNIATAMLEQAAGAEQISEAVLQLDNTIRDNTDASTMVLEKTIEQSRRAQAMNDACNFFTVDPSSDPDISTMLPLDAPFRAGRKAA